MSTAVFYDLENISKFTAPKNYGEFKDSVKMMCDSELVDDIVLQRAYISTTHPAYIKYNKFLNSMGIEICAVDPNTNSKKANLVDFKMNVDCIAYSLSNKIDTVVIATGDADFGFLCEELKNYGIHVVVASYGITTNKSIIMLSDDWVDFSEEYSLCDINELMASRISLDEPIDYKAAVRSVLEAMLSDKLIKRYMAMERFDLEMLRSFTEKFYKAPRLEEISYMDFISLLVLGIEVDFINKNGRILIVPASEAVPEPPLSIYEIISGMDFEFSIERFRAWHSWFEENIDSINELVYYMNFMTRNKLLNIDDENTSIVPQRKCAAALIEHTGLALSLLNIKPEEKELDKLKSRFYRNAVKHRPANPKTEEPEPEEPKQPEIYIQGTMTNFGRIVVYADNEAVTKVEFTDEFVKYRPNEVTALAAKELREYFKGERTEFTVPLRLEGSEFQKLVWQALTEIPYGETRTYKDIAQAIGKPRSARAVGTACNKNKLLFIIPCHRVVGTSGDLTGYAAGVELKTALLKSESSPVDFKRFGKQYTYNIKHPESRGEYRTAEEITMLLDKEEAEREEKHSEDESVIEDATAQEVAVAETPEQTDSEIYSAPIADQSEPESTTTSSEESSTDANERELQSAEPTDSAESAEPMDSTESAKPAELTEFTESAEPAELMDSTESAKPTEPTEITESAEPAESETDNTPALSNEDSTSESPTVEDTLISDEPNTAESNTEKVPSHEQTENISEANTSAASTENSEAQTDSAVELSTDSSENTDIEGQAQNTANTSNPTRKRRAPYRRRTKKTGDEQPVKRYSAKKHVAKKTAVKDDNSEN